MPRPLSILPRSRLGLYPAVAVLIAMFGTSGCLPAVPALGAAPAAQADAQSARASANTIRIGKAVRGDLNGVLTFTAPVQAKGEVGVVPRVSARLDQLHVELGSRVRAGDILADLDHSELDRKVQEAQAAQASAEAKLAELKAGPKPEVLAQAQANQKAAQARVNALEGARGTNNVTALDVRVQDARAAFDQAQAALQPDADKVAQADAVAAAARTKLNQLQSDPTKQNDKTALDAARGESQRADAAATAARQPTGTQAALDQARRDLQDAQQAQLLARLSTTAFDLDQ